MLKKSVSFVLSSLAEALLDDLFEHPAWYSPRIQDYADQ